MVKQIFNDSTYKMGGDQILVFKAPNCLHPFFETLIKNNMLMCIKFHTSYQHERCMTILVEKSMPFDLRTLRSFRCLRPLKMVSKVPSKFNLQ